MAVPLILRNIVMSLQQEPIAISEDVQGEGRAGSYIDEGTLKKTLNKRFPGHIIDETARKFADICVRDYDETIHAVNIKTSAMTSADNCFSKAGFVYALTNLDSTDPRLGSMNFNRMLELIHANKHHDPMKDYWFLCVDKTNPANVLCRGAKQIRNWRVNSNPSNILQIHWGLEKNSDPVERDWDEAYDVLVNGTKNSLLRFISNLPEEWKNEIY